MMRSIFSSRPSRDPTFRGRGTACLAMLLTAAPGMAFGESAPPETAASISAPIVNGSLPHDLSPWSMFLSADWVVKGVMVGLAFASIITWTVLLSKSIELTRAVRRQRRAFVVINQARSLAQAAKDIAAQDEMDVFLIETAQTELKLSADALDDRDGLKERIVSRLERLEAATSRRMLKGTGVLATIGATAPFVGLFGTVWGIMNSFIGISKAQTTNLAVVAPGIAEALLATAIGLVAAIPAVVIYNHFARQIAAYKALVADTSAAVMRLVSRDLSRRIVDNAEEPGLRMVAE